MSKRVGRFTVEMTGDVAVAACAAVAGKKEGEGPLAAHFDHVYEDELLGQDTFEQAERELAYQSALTCLKKANLSPEDVDFYLGGDLENQIMAASMAARALGTPFLGLYGACSTMAESLAVGAMLLDGGAARRALCGACSHFCTAERQYRFPLEFGSQRTPTAQWTVTGAGAALLSRERADDRLARVTHVTCGRLIDLGVKDANNMGAAMAPAAADTLQRHFADTGRGVEDYDIIITGDLGRVGHDALVALMAQAGRPLPEERYTDCGIEIFSPSQDTHAGGSGCGCSAVVLCSLVLRKLAQGALRRVLFMATGALLSPTTSQQGETIPGVAHAVALESPARGEAKR